MTKTTKINKLRFSQKLFRKCTNIAKKHKKILLRITVSTTILLIFKHVVFKKSTYIFNEIGIQPEKLSFATEISQSNLEIFTQFIKRKMWKIGEALTTKIMELESKWRTQRQKRQTIDSQLETLSIIKKNAEKFPVRNN